MTRARFDRRFVVLTAVYAVVLLFVGQRPGSQMPHLDPVFGIGADKIGHFFMYGLLGALAWRAQMTSSPTRHPIALAVAFVAIVGGTDELAQSLAKRGRTGDVRDLVADVSGAAVAANLAAVMWRRRG